MSLLGEVTIAAEGAPAVRITRRQDRLVLVRLLLGRPGPVTRDAVAEVVWPEDLPTTWSTALRGSLSRLRRALSAAGVPESSLSGVDGRLELRLPSDVRVDVDDALGWLEMAESDRSDPTRSVALAARARSVLLQPLLADCDGSWLDGRRVWLDDAHTRACRLEAVCAAETGDHRRALQVARVALVGDPVDEVAHRVVIAAHAATGDRAAALAAYERCRGSLRELGISPDPATEALHLAVLAAEPSVRASARALAFVGRDVEQARLAEAWRSVVAGHARAVILEGESGIGKTRLAEEMAELFASQGALVLRGREDPDAPVPFRSITEVLEHCVELRGADSLYDLGPAAGALTRLVPALADHVPRTGPVTVESAATARWELFDGVARWLGHLSVTEPVVVILDDVQWAFPPTVEMVRFVLEAATAARVLIIVTHRGDTTMSPALAGAFSALLEVPTAERLALGGLSDVDIVRLVDDSFHPEAGVGVIDPVGGLGRVIARRTDGNAQLVTEVVRHLRRELGPDMDEYAPDEVMRVAESVIPSSVADLVRLQLRSFGEATESVVRVAALAGERVSLAVLESACDVDGALGDHVEPAVREGLVTLERGVLEFAHELVRTAIVAGIAPADVAGIHRRLAVAAVTRVEDPSGGHDVTASFLAYHWYRCAGTGRAEAEEAVRWCRRAGLDAFERVAFDQAAAFFSMAREALASADPGELRATTWCDLRILEGEALHAAGRPAYREVLNRAIAGARRLGDPVRMARAALASGEVGMSETFGDDEDGRVRALREAFEALPGDELALRAQVGAVLAQELRWTEDPAWVDGMAADALEMSERSGDPRARATALICRGELGGLEPVEAMAVAGELVRLAERLDAATVGCWAAVIALDALVEVGDVSGAIEELARLERITSRVPTPYFTWTAMTRSAGLDALRGEYDRAAAVMDEAAGMGVTIGLHPGIVTAGQVALHLSIALESGRLGRVIDELRGVGSVVGDVPTWHASMAAALAEEGDPGARAHLDAVFSSLGPVRVGSLDVTTACNAARAAARMGDDRAGVLAPVLEARRGHLNWASCVSFGPVDLARAWVAAAVGDPGDAEGHFAAALELCGRNGLAVWSSRIERERTGSVGRSPGRLSGPT